MITKKDYAALDYLSTFGKSYLGAKGMQLHIDHRCDRIYSFHTSHRDEAKIYLLAESIVSRVQKMDIDKLDSSMILTLTEQHKYEMGTICDPKGSNIKVSTNYLVDNDQILLDVFLGNFGVQTVRYESGREDLSPMMKRFVGRIVIDKDKIDKIPCSAVTLLNMKTYKTGSNYREILLRMHRELEKIKNPAVKKLSLLEIFHEYPAEVKYSRAIYDDYITKYAILEYALRSFLFIYCSDSIKADYISEDSQSIKKDSNSVRNYILIDSLWDTEVNVLNPFQVKAHFTHQPYGKGRALRKLIYIESYSKKGYHRRAGKDIQLG